MNLKLWQKRIGKLRWMAGALSPLASRHQQYLKNLRNRHAGERAFILGNGPSLCIEQVDRLKSELTFASNKIWLLFDRTEWRPTYYGALDNLVVSQNLPLIEELAAEIPVFMPVQSEVWTGQRSDWAHKFWYEVRPFGPSLPRFSRNISRIAYSGKSITYFHLQLAFWMGFKEIYFIGMDFSFNVPKIYEKSEVIVSDGEVNHFDSRYRVEGERWNFPRQDLEKLAHRRARQVFEEFNGNIYNATPSSKLEEYNRVEFEKIPGI